MYARDVERPSKRDSEPRGNRRSGKILALGLGAALVASLGFAATRHSAAPHTATSNRPNPPRFAVPSSWQLTFDKGFAGSKLNESVWAACYPWETNGCTNYGNKDEREWFQPSQARVSGGALHLVAQQIATPGFDSKGKPKEYGCRSGLVTSYPGLRFKYGYIQVTARIPSGPGLWPALWLAASNKKWPPEIDILEHWKSATASSAYLHPLGGPRQGVDFSTPNLSKGWHKFSLYWTKTELRWFYDGRQVMMTTSGVPHQSMYFVADLASFNLKGPGIIGCTGSLLIKSVKVWESAV